MSAGPLHWEVTSFHFVLMAILLQNTGSILILLSSDFYLISLVDFLSPVIPTHHTYVLCALASDFCGVLLSDGAMASGAMWSLPGSALWVGPGENVNSDWQMNDVLIPRHRPRHRLQMLWPFFQASGLGLNKIEIRSSFCKMRSS